MKIQTKKKILQHTKNKRKKHTNKKIRKLDLLIIANLLLITVNLTLPHIKAAQNTLIHDAKTHRINGYNIQTIKPENWPKKYNVLGYTYQRGNIIIKSGRKLGQITETCVHEQLHNVLPDHWNSSKQHLFVEKVDSNIDTVTCQKFEERISSQHSPSSASAN